MRRCIPTNEQEDILRSTHDLAYGRHNTGKKTAFKALQSELYWPTMFRMLKNGVRVVINVKKNEVPVEDKKCLKTTF